uniref:Alpha-macroglobulin receptor-binding domain-containing protein n=1 Tax=Anopheles minimus TaxID=112268 RepID=A0A182WFE4_9DIPT
MCTRAVIWCLALCTFTGSAYADEGDYISIFTGRSSAGSDNVSIMLANMDTAVSTFEIENIGMEVGDLIVSTTVDPKHIQLYVIPQEWSSATGEEAIQLDIVTSSRTAEEARLTGQIQLAQQPKVLIQLNDVFHAPGDYLKYRILLTDEVNKPLARTEHPVNLTIALQHEAQHTVASWDAQLYPGDIYSDQHLFVDDRDIGDWNLTVNIGHQITTKRFQVMLYSAPIHKITINKGPMNTFRDRFIEMTVEAMYTFGKPIRGVLTITLTGDANLVMERVYTIDGRKSVEIPIDQLFWDLTADKTRIVHINATVTTKNGLTQRKYHQSKSIEIYSSPYKVVAQRTVDFTPGHNATLFVRAMRANGKPLKELKFRNNISVNVKLNNEDYIQTAQFEGVLDNDDVAVVSIPTHSSTELLEVRVLYQDVSTSITLEPDYSPQLQVHVVTSKHQKTRNGFKLSLVSSHPMDGVLTVVRKHSGENIPLYINCNLQNYYEHYVPLVRALDVKRIYVFARFGDTLVQASTSSQEPALEQQVHLSMDGANIKVSTKEDNAHVGIAIYEGELDKAQLESIYKRAMFNGSVYPENEDVIPLSINDLKVMPSLQQLDYNQQDGNSNIATSPLNRLLLWEEAFAFGPTGGLGIAEPIQWQRRQDIEIYLHIPYSAKKLEAVTVDVYIVNNRAQIVEFVLVELLNIANEFSFLNNSGRTDAIKKSVHGRLKPNEVQRAEFLIRPKKLGSIILRANAYTHNSIIASAESLLRTVPESVQRTGTIARFFNLDNSTERFDGIKIPIPHTVDVGSEKITVSLHGEQLQIAALPATILLDSLAEGDPSTMAMKASLTLDVLALGKLEWTERKALAKNIASETVVQILSFAQSDGSFIIPNQNAPSSRCWNTLIAVQALTRANEHLKDAAIAAAIVDALNWLSEKQASDGYFCTDDDGEQSELERIEMTAHALLAYYGMRSYTWSYISVIDSARNYLLTSTSNLRDPYHLALVGYVLTFSLKPVTGGEDLVVINEKLSYITYELLIRKKQTPSGLKMWWNSTASATDLETTAYALLLMTSKKQLLDAAPIVNWMKGQPYRRVAPGNITSNSHIALRALIDYAKHTTFLEKQYSARVIASGKTGEISRQELHHNSSDHVLKLPPTTRLVSLSISGTISGAFEINYSYMESVTMQTQKFDIDLLQYKTSDADYTDWRVCIRFIPKGSTEKTHMVTCEISFPTGYIALDDSVSELNQLDDVVTTVLRNDETQLSITFEEIGLQQKCFNVTGFRRNEETRQLPGTIKVFDLADASNVAFKQLGIKP